MHMLLQAEMLDLNLSDDFAKLNFIGVVSLFGGEIALSALRYSVLVHNVVLSLYFTMILSPGLQTVSLKMFKRMEDKVSRAIGGGSDDRKDIIGMSASSKYKYVGLHSGTKMNVSSILGEALIGASKPMETIEVACSRGVSGKRNIRLKVIELDNSGMSTCAEKYGSRISVKGRPPIRLCIIPAATITGLVIAALAEDYQVFALILLNVICNMLVTFTIRSNGVKYPVGNAAKDSPKGDIFVETVDGTDLCLVMGDEDIIQYIFQRPLIMPPHPDNMMWRYLHMLAAYSSYIMVVVNIIWLPFCSASGQIIFGVLIFFGVVQNILLATFDGDDLLMGVAKEFFATKSVKEYVFQTRSSVIAFCMIKSGSKDTKPLRHLLPDTETFDTWFKNVAGSVDGKAPDGGIIEGLLHTLNIDLQDAIKECGKNEMHIVD